MYNIALHLVFCGLYTRRKNSFCDVTTKNIDVPMAVPQWCMGQRTITLGIIDYSIKDRYAQLRNKISLLTGG